MRHGPAPSSCVVTASVLLLLGRAAAGAAPEQSPVFDRDRPLWSELDFSASKFLISATARVKARVRPSREISGRLLTTPAGHPVAIGDDVLEMIYSASGFGRQSVTTLWADPVSGGALQLVQRDEGGRDRQRIYRFTDIGAYHYTRWPASNREESLGPDQWTERTEGMRPYSEGSAGKPVTEPTALLWLAGAADLSRTGDHMEAFTFSRKRVNRVLIDVVGTRAVKVDFTETDASGEHSRRGQVNAIQLRIRGSSVIPTNDADDEFELLGLHGDLELLLDPRTRAPLQLQGRVKVVGDVTARLRRAVLR